MSSLTIIPNSSLSTHIGFPGDIAGNPCSVYYAQFGQIRRGYGTPTQSDRPRSNVINLKGLDPELLDKSKKAYDINNSYIPLFNILCYNLISGGSDSLDFILEYGIPNIEELSRHFYGHSNDFGVDASRTGLSIVSRRYNDAIAALATGSYLCALRFTFEGAEEKLIFSRGVVFTLQGEPLLIVGVKKDTFYSIISDHDKSHEVELTNENTVLFISREFSENPKYRNVYRRVHTEFILPLTQYKLDVVESFNISDWALKTTELDYRFPTISKITEHCEQVVTDYFNDVL